MHLQRAGPPCTFTHPTHYSGSTRMVSALQQANSYRIFQRNQTERSADFSALSGLHSLTPLSPASTLTTQSLCSPPSASLWIYESWATAHAVCDALLQARLKWPAVFPLLAAYIPPLCQYPSPTSSSFHLDMYQSAAHRPQIGRLHPEQPPLMLRRSRPVQAAAAQAAAVGAAAQAAAATAT